jgi:hypothetical protein
MIPSQTPPIEPKPSPFPIYQWKSTNEHRRDIQLGYEHFLLGMFKGNDWIPYEWYSVLHSDSFIAYDPEATMDRKNCLSNETTPEEIKRLKRGQDYVIQCFQMAKDQGRTAIYKQEL